MKSEELEYVWWIVIMILVALVFIGFALEAWYRKN